MANDPEIFKVSVLGKESIHCGFHLSPYIADTVLRTLPASTYVLLTDTHIASFHLSHYESVFEAAIRGSRPSARFLSKVIAPGETSKSREGKADIEDFLLDHSCTRDTVLITMGGGVIGDLGGFVAATFMRGIRFVQIPTTLLSMVDSSVGGKTAIDTPHGKNLIGAFWQPEYIFIDASFLETLPAREVANGMAEVIKTAAIWNEEEFEKLETRSVEILAATEQRSSQSDAVRTLGQGLLLSVIVGSISVKAHIVTVDERETGLRNLVNFGHSIGHALEAVLTPAVLHGECISVGMILEAELARQLGILNQVAVGRLTRCLKAYKLPISVTDSLIASLPAADLLTNDRLLNIMKVDKKNVGSQKKIVLLKRIGATYEQKATSVDDDVIRRTLSLAIRVIPTIPKHPVRMAPPGSKSISNRAMVIAALGRGTVRITNLLHSDDTQVMMSALVELKGAEFSWEDGGEMLVVKGGEGSLTVPPKGKELYLGNAGTASRFLATVCTLVRSDKPGDSTVITGNARMKERPIGPLVDALRSNGSEVSYLGKDGSLPLSIAASPTGFRGSHIQLTANVSSQYVSSILLCAPYATEPVTLELIGGQVISQPYIDMTISMMKTFGVVVVREKDENGKPLNIYHIPKATYINPLHYEIESDASSATYPLAIAAVTGTSCTITNIGSSSLQGDAGFAKGVLEPMGCTVIQSETETTVVGPPVGQLKALGLVDMETMTDAFLTATALAAVAGSPKLERRLGDAPHPHTSRILGIANQRVKECNRIRAMIDQLAKFGIDTKELDDGLEIYGRPIGEVKNGVNVHCYDDHRVAMAFSVLAAVVGGTVLEEKRCVEKTWPNWWDDLGNKIGIPCEGVELDVSSVSETLRPTQVDPSATFFLIGMRGAGKTFIGQLAAKTLGRKFIDADDWFDEKYGPLAGFVAKHGWPEFRKRELALLQEALETKRNGHVISLGGGVLETPACRDLLKAYGREGGPVVQIVRDIEEIHTYLAEETARPGWGEPFQQVVKRRLPWFTEVATYEFVCFIEILHPPNSPQGSIRSHLVPPDRRRGIKDEVGRFFGHISGVRPNLAVNLELPGRRTYFLSLTYSDITASSPVMDRLTEGADAVELRVDLLHSTGFPSNAPNVPSRSYVTNQLAALRQLTSLPVVFTVRTVSQGGAFPDTAEKEAFELYDLAVRSGVEYIDIEITWNRKTIQSFIRRKGKSKIIASYHNWSGTLKWDGDVVKEKYDLGASFGDIVKIVGKANTIGDNFSLLTLQSRIAKRPDSRPLIAINMGQEGQLSRVLNPTFSPISHPLLPTRAAPGQLSFVEIQKALHLIGQLPAQQYYLIGDPIHHSVSPTLHNTAHAALGLPHKYSLFETAEVDAKVEALLAQPDFGGASVTIPHKIAIIPLLNELSPHAKAIGAVNTVIPRIIDGKRDFYGDNTDWLAIRDLVLSNLSEPVTPKTTGLIIGAGGTSRAAIYALHQLGIPRIYIYNRTQSAAHALSSSLPSEYNLSVIETLDKFSFASPPSVIVSTVPGPATSASLKEPGTLFLPKSIFSNPNGGVVVDMAYKPMDTPILKLAYEVSLELAAQPRTSPPPGEPTPAIPKWVTVPGVMILLEQGFYQFEIWTGRKAPRETVQDQVWAQYSANS